MDKLQHKSKCVKYTTLKPNRTMFGEGFPLFFLGCICSSIYSVTYELIYFFKLEFTAKYT